MTNFIDYVPEKKQLHPFVTFGDCEKGETAAKTGCTPASGGGGKKEGEAAEKWKEESFDAFNILEGIGEKAGIDQGTMDNLMDDLYTSYRANREGEKFVPNVRDLESLSKKYEKEDSRIMGLMDYFEEKGNEKEFDRLMSKSMEMDEKREGLVNLINAYKKHYSE